MCTDSQMYWLATAAAVHPTDITEDDGTFSDLSEEYDEASSDLSEEYDRCKWHPLFGHDESVFDLDDDPWDRGEDDWWRYAPN
jgi:hypothetical protein